MAKLITAGLICLFFVLVIWVVIGMFSSGAPDPATADTKNVQAFLASDNFARLPAEERSKYLQQMRAAAPPRQPGQPGGGGRRGGMMFGGSEDMTDAERDQLRRNIGDTREDEMVAQAVAFFKLSPEEQEKEMDRRMDEMDAQRKQWQDRRAQAQADGATTERPPRPEGQRGTRGGGPGGRRQPNADRMQKHQEERLAMHTPAERAAVSEYFRRMREAREKRREQVPK